MGAYQTFTMVLCAGKSLLTSFKEAFFYDVHYCFVNFNKSILRNGAKVNHKYIEMYT